MDSSSPFDGAELSEDVEQATAAMELSDPMNDEVQEPAPMETTASSQNCSNLEEGINPAAMDSNGEDEDNSLSATDSTDDEDDVGVSPQQADLVLIKATGLKETGNEEFQKGEYDKAARSYRRGVNALKKLNRNNAGDLQVRMLLATLYTNLSTVSFKQSKFRVSAEVAGQAIRIDAANSKALYRRAVAYRKLGQHDEARTDLRSAIAMNGPNRAVCQKELAAIKKELEDSRENQKKALARAFGNKSSSLLYDDKVEAEKKKAEEERRQKLEQEKQQELRKVEWEDECVRRMAKSEPAISFEDWEKEREEKEKALEKEAKRQRQEEAKRRREERRSALKAAKENKDDDDDDDVELTEAELRMMRGYKKTADGRTTSYFTRELSEEDKNRMGDMAPKRLDAFGESPTSSNNENCSSGNEVAATVPVSKWNQAGTWEERDTTPWCRDQLRMRLLEETSKNATSHYAIAVTSITDLTGDASVAVVSGKKRYIFDFHAKAEYEIKQKKDDGKDGIVVAKGVVRLPDICSAHHEEMEVLFDAWKKAPKRDADQVTSARETLAEQLRSGVQLFVQDFNAMY